MSAPLPVAATAPFSRAVVTLTTIVVAVVTGQVNIGGLN